MSRTEETELFSRPLLFGGAVHALGSLGLCTSLSVIAARPLELPSWLCSCTTRGLCVYIYCWAALRHLISAQTPLCSVVSLAGVWYEYPVGLHVEKDLVLSNSERQVYVLGHRNLYCVGEGSLADL